MNRAEIIERAMLQSGNDMADLSEMLDAMAGYVNEGYSRLYRERHADAEPLALMFDEDVPRLPTYLHAALADYATYCIYRNGNQQKQSRGAAFLAAFEKARQQGAHYGSFVHWR